MSTSNYFQAGGTVSSSASCYISRACDEKALTALISHRYLSVLGPRQIGKTSLLFKLQMSLERRSIPCAIIDLSTLPGADASSSASSSTTDIAALWYNQLAAQLQRQLSPKASSSAAYQDNSVQDLPSFLTFLNNLEVISKPKRQAIIMFDEAATVPPVLKTLFFSSLRMLLNNRPDPRAECASRIDFVFAGAFYPDALVTDALNSPFNVSHEIYVPDFQRHEVEKLLQGFAQLQVRIEPTAIDEIWDAAGGHPFLTQKICQSLVQSGVQEIRPNDVKAVVNHILGHDAHLQNLVRRLDESPTEVEMLRRVILRREKVRLNPIVNTAMAQLEMLGALTVGPDGFARVRNGIYGRLLRAYLADRVKT